MCDKAVDTCPFVFELVPDRYKIQEMYDKVVSNDLFMPKYWLDQYKAKEMCDKTVDDCLSALKSVSDWFLTGKILEKLRGALFANDDIPFFGEDFSSVTFFANGIGTLSVDLDKIYLDDVKFCENYRETVISVRLFAWRNKFEQRKTFKKHISK